MLGLVAYGGSSDEEDESSNDSTDVSSSTKPPVSINSATKTNNIALSGTPNTTNSIEPHISDEEDDVSYSKPSNTVNNPLDISSSFDNLESISVSSSSTVFHSLPTPTSHNLNPTSSVLATGKKSTSSVKIMIPSLDEFDEEEEELSETKKKKKITASLKGSGLFSLLPKPRHDFLATPRQAPTISPTSSKKANSLVPRQVANKHLTHSKPVRKKTANLVDNDDDSDEANETGNDEMGNDFFTIPDKIESLQDDAAVNIEEYMKPVRKLHDDTQPDASKPSLGEQGTSGSSVDNETDHDGANGCVMYPAYEPHSHIEEGDVEITDEVIRKLGGRKRKGEDMNSVVFREVDGKALMPDSKEWLTKALSQETAYRPSHKKGDGPTSQQKRKHQITYLAFQAKANEVDLKNQWANNRQSKRQTQNKYGF